MTHRPRLLPPVGDGAALDAALGDATIWPRAIAVVCERHGLARGPIARAGRGSFGVFFVGDRHVAKFVPERWRPQYQAELLLMPRLHGRLPVATPELVAAGDLDDWGYLVATRVRGRPLADVVPVSDAEAMAPLLRSVGATMAALHALPTEGLEPIAPDWPAFIERQRASSVARHDRPATPRAWIAEVSRWVDAIAPELAAPSRSVAMTADVTHEAVLVDDVNGRLEVTGLVDFGDALVGDPAYDFVSPAAFLVRGRRDLLAALLDGYGLAPDTRTPALRRRFMGYSLLHRFSWIGRDAGFVIPALAPGATLDDALAALWPM
jgi:hygromycin-B 7''-O-kinase